MLDPVALERFASLEAIPSIRHAFACAAAFGGFDAARDADRERLRAAVHPEARHLVRTTQTHSANVALVSLVNDEPAILVQHAETEKPQEPGVDGLVTRERGVLCHAISADCPLLLLATEDGEAVGIAHCGWRGVARGIVAQVIRRLSAVGDCATTRLIGVVSPGAGGCCYEVGQDVIDALTAVGVEVAEVVSPYRHPDGRITRALDLKRAIAQLAVDSGMRHDAIEVASACSICGGARFHSYRRQGRDAGRMSGVIGRV